MNSWLLQCTGKVVSAREWSKTLQKLTFDFKTIVPWLSFGKWFIELPILLGILIV